MTNTNIKKNLTTVLADELWKAVIEDFFEAFMHYFYTDYVHLINFEAGVTFLDKELQKLNADVDVPNRRVDKLAKVVLHSGEEKHIYVHVEVQGYDDDEFPNRMFNTFYRLYESKGKYITTMVIFTKGSPKHQINTLELDFMGTSMSFQYNMFRLADYTPATLPNKQNPFRAILELAWYDRSRAKLTDEKLYTIKVRLLREIIDLGFEPKKLKRFFNFLKYTKHFKEETFEEKFNNEIEDQLKIIAPMGITETINRYLEEKGRVEGKIEGRAEAEIATKKNAVLSLLEEGFNAGSISRILKYELTFVEGIISEMAPTNKADK